MKKYISLILLTLISGFASGYGVTLFDGHNGLFPAAPGILFGILLGIWFLFTQKTNIRNIIFWVITSIVAYGIAWYVTAISGRILSDYSIFFTAGGLVGSFTAGGLICSMILAFSTNFFIVKLNFKNIILISLLGGITGSIFGFTFIVDNMVKNSIPDYNFVIWQMVVGIALGIMVDYNNQKSAINLS